LCDRLRPDLAAIETRRAVACHVVAREQAERAQMVAS